MDYKNILDYAGTISAAVGVTALALGEIGRRLYEIIKFNETIQNPPESRRRDSWLERKA